MPSRTKRPRLPVARQSLTRLEQLPNVGPSLAGDLRRVGVAQPRDLVGRDPFALYDALYDALCDVSRTRQDPCVLDVFMSAVHFMEGAPALPWWHYTAERKRALSGQRTRRAPRS